jgi:hypothetical protein
MDLTTRYVECYTRFCSYLIDNNIVDVDEDVLHLLLQNNLRESLGKSKMSSTNRNVCRSIIKSGKREGEECGKSIKNDSDYCKLHSKKEKAEEKTSKVVFEDDEDILIIKKNKFNNFVYGNTGLIFKSSLEKYIVAKEGMNGEWLPLDEIDIDICKEYNLKWKIIQNKFKGEKTNIDIIKKYDIFPSKEEVEIDRSKREFRYLDIDEEFNEN